MKPYKLGKSGNRRWGKVLLFVGILVIILGVAGYLGVRTVYEKNLRAVNTADTEQVAFTIASGATPGIIAEDLQSKNLIRSAKVFVQYVRTEQVAEKFIAGTYKLQRSMSVQRIVEVLTSGQVATDLFTIFPGQRIESVRQSLIADGGFTAAEVDAALNPAQYAGHPALVDKPEGASLEGYLYPDSYEKIAETRPQTIITQALDEMAEALTPDIRAGIASHGLSIYQGITLASIVEKEVGAVDIQGNPNENRAKAAQVFLKRLKIGMMLQSNATDLAAEERGEEYDTYSIPGLPPGPVSNVSASALSAVAYPASTDYLYFVSGTDCVTRFSETLDQHETLKAQHGIATAEDECRG